MKWKKNVEVGSKMTGSKRKKYDCQNPQIAFSICFEGETVAGKEGSSLVFLHRSLKHSHFLSERTCSRWSGPTSS